MLIHERLETHAPQRRALQPAPRTRRLAAASVDWWVLLFLVLLWVFLQMPRFDPIWFPLFASYAGPFWSLGGTSVGKWLFGLALVGPDGRRPGVRRALVRLAVLLLLSPLGITWWAALLRPDGRALHDLAAGTQVVLVRSDGLGWHVQAALVRFRWLVVTLLSLGAILTVRLAEDLLRIPR